MKNLPAYHELSNEQLSIRPGRPLIEMHRKWGTQQSGYLGHKREEGTKLGQCVATQLRIAGI